MFWRNHKRSTQRAVVRLPRSTRGTKENPYFNKRVQRQAVRIAPVVGGISAAVLICGAVTAALAMPHVAIREIKIDGHARLTREHIDDVIQDYMREPVAFFFFRSNYFLFNGEALRSRLEALPEVAGVDVSKRFPGKATIRITEREAAYQILTDDARVLADEYGRAFALYPGEGGGEPVIIASSSSPFTATTTSSTDEVASSTRRLPPPTSHPLPKLIQILTARQATSTFTLYDTSNVAAQPGEEAVPDSIRTAYERTQQHVRDEHDLTVLGGIFQRTVLSELRVVLSDGWYIILDPGFDVEKALQNMSGVMREKIRDTSTLQYIDVRYADRVYYK